MAIDIKPVMDRIIDTKPGMITPGMDTERYYNVTINAGMPIGLLLSLTYPVGFTVSSPKTN